MPNSPTSSYERTTKPDPDSTLVPRPTQEDAFTPTPTAYDNSSSQKPNSKKITIDVIHEGQSTRFSIKPTSTLAKLIEKAAEKLNKDIKSLKFYYGNTRLRGHETPADLEMEDGDEIDAYLGQIGGSKCSCPDLS